MTRGFWILALALVFQGCFLLEPASAQAPASGPTELQLRNVEQIRSEELAKLEIDDPLLYQAYLVRIGYEPGERGPFVEAVDADMERRGDAVESVLVRIFREYPDEEQRRIVLIWLTRKESWPAEAILNEARQAYASQDLQKRTALDGALATALARRGVASDMNILLKMQRLWGGNSFEYDILELQTRIDAAKGGGKLPPLHQTNYQEIFRARTSGKATRPPETTVQKANPVRSRESEVPPSHAASASSKPLWPWLAGGAVLALSLGAILWRWFLRRRRGV